MRTSETGLYVNDWLSEQRGYLDLIRYWQTEHVAWTMTTLPAYRHWLATDLRRKILTDIEESYCLHYPVRAKALLELLAELNNIAPPEEDTDDE